MANQTVLHPGGAQKGQLSYLNYLRFGSILLVILLHSVSDFVVDPFYFSRPSYGLILAANEIGRAGVPLFFMISGYLLLRDPRTLQFGDFYRRRLSRILLPLVVWNGVYCVYYDKGIATFFAESIHQGCAYHLWFLYTIMGIYLLTPFLKRIVDQCTRKQLWWLLILIAFTGTLRPMFNLLTPFYLYLFPPMMEGYIAYFLFGYLLGTEPSPGKKARPLALLLIVSGFALGMAGNLLFSTQEELTLPFNSGYSLNHFLLAGGIFLLARTLHRMEQGRANTVGRLLSALTFQTYFVHVLVMGLTRSWVPDVGPILNIVITFVVTAVGSVAFALAVHVLQGMIRSKRASAR